MTNSNKTIRVLVCRPGQSPEVKDIVPNVYAIKEIVGGWFAAIKLVGPNTGINILYCRDKPDGEFNRTVRNQHNIFGTFLISKVEGGKEVSLSDQEIESLTTELSAGSMYSKIDFN